MYDIIFKSDHFPQNYVVMQKNLTMKEAAQLRSMAGDLVVHAGTTKVVFLTDEWLFPWEKEAATCYAKREMQMAKVRWQKRLPPVEGREIPRSR